MLASSARRSAAGSASGRRNTPPMVIDRMPTITAPVSGREQRLPTHAVVGGLALGLGQHEHEQERDQDRAGIDDDRGHGQELGAGEEEQPGRAQQRQAEPDRAVDRIAERDGRGGRDDRDRRPGSETRRRPSSRPAAAVARRPSPRRDAGQHDPDAASAAPCRAAASATCPARRAAWSRSGCDGDRSWQWIRD